MEQLKNLKIVQSNIDEILVRLQQVQADETIAAISTIAENIPILARELKLVIRDAEKDKEANIDVYLFDYARMLRMADLACKDALGICARTGLIFK